MNKENLLQSLIVLASENLELETKIKEALIFMEDNFYYHDGVLVTIPTEESFKKLKNILLRGGVDDE